MNNLEHLKPAIKITKAHRMKEQQKPYFTLKWMNELRDLPQIFILIKKVKIPKNLP